MICDGLTHGTKVIGHALHPVRVVAEVALLEDMKLGVELQNVQLAIAEELCLDRAPRLSCGLRRFPNDLVEFWGEGAKDPCHHDAVQSSLIDGRIGDVREDVVVQGIAMKHEKHEVASPLVVGRRGFQNDCDHRSYVLEVGSLRMQVCDKGGVRVGADVVRAIVVVILGDRDPLGIGELLFQVTDDGLFLLPSEGGGVLARPGLIQGLACGSHVGDESFLLSMRGSGGGLSRGCGVVLLPLGDGGGRDRVGLLLIDGEVGCAAWYDRQDDSS
jgi:hypothetical protein